MTTQPSGTAGHPSGTARGTSWTAFRNREATLRNVIDKVDFRLDGNLPAHLPEVVESFRDGLDLVGALQLRWHARLSVAIEQQLALQPMDLPAAVEAAWVATARELPGIRLVLDRHLAEPTSTAMAQALGRAQAKERVLLATVAGQANQADDLAQAAGARIEEAARATYLGGGFPTPGVTGTADGARVASPSFVDRLKAALAAA